MAAADYCKESTVGSSILQIRAKKPAQDQVVYGQSNYHTGRMLGSRWILFRPIPSWFYTQSSIPREEL